MLCDKEGTVMNYASAVLLITLQIASSNSSKAQTAERANATSNLAITLKTERSTYKVGEQVTVLIEIKNVSNKPYCEFRHFESGYAEVNDFRISARNSAGVAYSTRKVPYPRIGMSAGRECLDSNKAWQERLAANRLLDMSEPGVYIFQVDHIDRETKMTVVSNEVPVTLIQ
jgi:hypothetical protein